MRAFAALDIPSEQVLAELVKLQHELAETGADVKLVERENLHFTVKFLGEITEAQASEADLRLRSLTLPPPIDVSVKGVGAFPGGSRPRVIWAGIAPGEAEEVARLATCAIQALDGIGEKDERGFQAHLTLARVRSERNREALSSLLRQNSQRDFGRVRLSELKLKSSELTPRGPIYRDIGVYPLT
jgi:2'-5' RNA ligase